MADPLRERDAMRSHELWEGRCVKCTMHWVEQGSALAHAFASVGIEHGKSSFDMAMDYFAEFHKRGHVDE